MPKDRYTDIENKSDQDCLESQSTYSSKREIAGAFLREIRNKRGFTLAQMGETLGKSRLFLSELERGKKRMPDIFIREVSTVLGIEEDVLFKILGRPSLAAREELENSLELQRILSFIHNNKNINDEQREVLRTRLLQLYYDFVSEFPNE